MPNTLPQTFNIPLFTGAIGAPNHSIISHYSFYYIHYLQVGLDGLGVGLRRAVHSAAIDG